MNFYHFIPYHINPIIFSIGPFSVRWYSVMYLVAFSVFYLLINYRIKKEEFYVNPKSKIRNPKQIRNPKFEIQNSMLFDFIIYAIIGLLVGARLGYAIFYNPGYYFQNPLEIIFPQNIATGISGMSYYGGLIGIVLAAIFFTRKNKIEFWKFADFIIPAIPAAYFFGRIGNFLNGELFGRMTNSWIGMYFPLDNSGLLRHPSQLYEAFFEGIVLFIILWSLRNKSKFPGYLSCLYLFGYGFFRFFIEFFREPDPQIGFIFGFLTLGQIFSLILITFAVTIFFLNSKLKNQS